MLKESLRMEKQNAQEDIACERRRISGCRFSPHFRRRETNNNDNDDDDNNNNYV